MRAAHRHHRGRGGRPRSAPSTCARSRTRSGTCCPGPTYVKSFLRTYAEYLGLDGTAAGRGVQAAATSGRERAAADRAAAGRASRAGAAPARGAALRARWLVGRPRARRSSSLIVLLALGRGDDNDDGATRRPRRPRRRSRRTTSHATSGGQQADAPRSRQRCACSSSRPAGLGLPASTRAGKPLVDGRDPRSRATDADRSAPSASASTLGNGAVDAAHQRQAPQPCRAVAARSATRSRRAGARALPRRPAADLQRRERPRGHRRHRHRGADRRVTDRNGPWLAERLRELGVELAHIVDRRRPARGPARRRCASCAREGMDLIVTSGGLGPDRGRPDGRGGRPTSRAASWCSTRRWRSGSREILGGSRALAATSTRRRCARPTASRRWCREGADDPRPGRDRARARRAARRRRSGPRWSCCPGPPRELQPMWARGAGDRARSSAALARAHGATGRTMLRLFGIPESEIAETLRVAEARGVDARRARDHDLPAPRRDRDRRRATSPTREAGLRRVRGRRPRAPRRHAVLRRRHDDRRAGRGAAAGAGAHGRGGGVVHRRAAGGAADRPARLLGVLARRRGRLLERGEDRSCRRRPGADRARTARSRPRSPRRWPTARSSASAPTRRSGSPASPGRAAAREEKPVGHVCFSVRRRAAAQRIDAHACTLPGARADVRDRSTTVALHLLRRLLLGRRRSDA